MTEDNEPIEIDLLPLTIEQRIQRLEDFADTSIVGYHELEKRIRAIETSMIDFRVGAACIAGMKTPQGQSIHMDEFYGK